MIERIINHDNYCDQSSLSLDRVNIALGNTLGPDDFNKQRIQIRRDFFRNNPSSSFWYNRPPTKDYLNRRRYRLKEELLIFGNMADDWNTGFSLTYLLMPKEFRDEWLNELHFFGVHLITDEHFIREYLGKISQLYFSSGRHIHYWKFFTGLELLGDFHVSQDDIIEGNIGEWFLEGDTYLNKTIMAEKDWYSLFKKHVVTAINNLNVLKIKETVREFFDNRKMDLGRSGATTFLYDKKYTKNKWNTAVHIDYDKYKQMIQEYDYNTSKVFIKRENKKPRLVVNGDTKYNIICELVWRFIREKDDDGIYTYMKDSDTKYLDYLEDMGLLRRGKVSFPIDQSSFDHKITHEMMLIIADEIIKKCKANHLVRDDDMEEAFELFREGISNHWVEKPSGEKVKTVKGLPSGSRWTILMDTLISHILNDMALELAGIETIKRGFTGDDVNAFVMNEIDAKKLAQAYTDIGVGFHPAKSYISKQYSEYLRVIVKHFKLEGYPLRSIHSVTISNPAKEVRGWQDIEIQTVCESWLNLYYRGFELNEVLKHMITDLQNSMLSKYDKITITDFLCTDKIDGGLGMRLLFEHTGYVHKRRIKLVTERELYFKNKVIERKYYLERKELTEKFNPLEVDKGVLDSLLKTKYRYTFNLVAVPRYKLDEWKVVGENKRYRDQVFTKAMSILDEMKTFGNNNPKFYKSRTKVKKAINYKFSGGILYSRLYNSNLVNEIYLNINNEKKLDMIKDKYKVDYISTTYNRFKWTKRAFEDFQSLGFKFRYSLNYHPNFISSFYKNHFRFFLNVFSSRFKGRITSGVLDNLVAIYHNQVDGLVSNFIAGRIEL